MPTPALLDFFFLAILMRPDGREGVAGRTCAGTKHLVYLRLTLSLPRRLPPRLPFAFQSPIILPSCFVAGAAM